jgi:hypothetical protein
LSSARPEPGRRREADRRRVDHLRQIASAVNLHWTRHLAIPTTLGQIAADGHPAIAGRDPVTAEPYEYRLINARSYEVCARFQGPSDPGAAGAFWHHQAGRQCFRLEVETVRP